MVEQFYNLLFIFREGAKLPAVDDCYFGIPPILFQVCQQPSQFHCHLHVFGCDFLH